jgi:protein-disulfide isomerase
MKRKNIILLISISAILAIIIMLISSIGNDSISSNIISNNQLSQPEIINSYGVSRSLEGDYVLSLGSPKNTIIEYASMTCPHCSDFHNETFPKIKAELIDSGRVKYIFRDFPLDQYAMAGTLIANCVADDKYFDVINVLLKTQKKWMQNGYQGLLSIAKNFGLSISEVELCLTNEKLIKLIESNMNIATNNFGITGTPSVFVNGKKITSLDYQEMLAEIK